MTPPPTFQRPPQPIDDSDEPINVVDAAAAAAATR